MLNDIKKIKAIDKYLVSESIDSLPNQIEQVLRESKSIKIPANYKKINKIVINGMGGSNLGAGVVKAVFADSIKYPFLICPGYEVPKMVDKNTLYIISSYSGNTEEPLSTYIEAKKRGAKILALTAKSPKSKLYNMMQKYNIPGYAFEEKNNPSNQPRLGIGHSMFGTLALLEKTGVIKIKPEEKKKLVDSLKKNNKTLTLASKESKNLAKKIAKKIENKEPIIVGAEFLMGNLRILRNQFCENSKNFASYLALPELNHYAMEGLSHPVANRKNLIFLFINSSLYHSRIQKRGQLTKKVVKQNKIQSLDINLKGKSKLEQAFEMLQLGTWITYYLSMLYKVDPVKIPFVNWFKKQLK